jgi:hypothetical protein
MYNNWSYVNYENVDIVCERVCFKTFISVTVATSGKCMLFNPWKIENP